MGSPFNVTSGSIKGIAAAGASLAQPLQPIFSPLVTCVSIVGRFLDIDIDKCGLLRLDTKIEFSDGQAKAVQIALRVGNEDC